MSALAEAVLRVAPLARQLGLPLTLPGEFRTATALFSAAGLVCLTGDPSDDAGSAAFDRVVCDALAAAQKRDGVTADVATEAEAEAEIARAHHAAPWTSTFALARPDGIVVSGASTEATGDEPVLLLGAPGLPMELLEPWARVLAPHTSVAAWRTRGLFERDKTDIGGADLGVAAQVGDAVAVLDHLGWTRARLLGLCGGAALALAVAAAAPDRVGGLSLWLGDYETGSPDDKSDHQRNLQALMTMTLDGALPVETLHSMLISTMTMLSDAELAPLAVYPYANPILLFDYCRMNASVMGTDCRPHLAALSGTGIPAQVVTSTSDSTVHSAGSRVVARGLSVELTEISGHDHLGIFQAPDDCAALATEFLSRRENRS